MFNIVLLNPQIPNNTGSIGRICVNTKSILHIIKPIGFDISDRAVKRSGMDYWDKVNLKIYENIDFFFKTHIKKENRFFFLTTKIDKPYFKEKFKKNDYLIFGSENKGICENILKKYINNNLTIPMSKEGRSINLAVCVGIVLYEAIKQNFKDFI